MSVTAADLETQHLARVLVLRKANVPEPRVLRKLSSDGGPQASPSAMTMLAHCPLSAQWFQAPGRVWGPRWGK